MVSLSESVLIRAVCWDLAYWRLLGQWDIWASRGVGRLIVAGRVEQLQRLLRSYCLSATRPAQLAAGNEVRQGIVATKSALRERGLL